MRVPRLIPILAAVASVVSLDSAQSSGLTQRVPNTTLTFPLSPPVYGYITTNAFGSLTLTNPAAMASPTGETNRLFVAEQRGRVAVVTNLLNPTRTVFLDISSRVVGGVPNDERGLLGLAFHPGYATNRYFFVFYSTTSTTPGVATNALHQRLSRFQTMAGDPDHSLKSG